MPATQAHTQPTLRPAIDADGAAIGALITRIFGEYEGCRFVQVEFPELAAVATHFAARDGAIFVAEHEGRVVACGAVARAGGEATFSLHRFYAEKRLRGGGLAGKMLALALAHARARGARRIEFFSDARFRRGHAFYEKHGFKRLPGVRNLNDLSASLEYLYRLEVAVGA